MRFSTQLLFTAALLLASNVQACVHVSIVIIPSNKKNGNYMNFQMTSANITDNGSEKCWALDGDASFRTINGAEPPPWQFNCTSKYSATMDFYTNKITYNTDHGDFQIQTTQSGNDFTADAFTDDCYIAGLGLHIPAIPFPPPT